LYNIIALERRNIFIHWMGMHTWKQGNYRVDRDTPSLIAIGDFMNNLYLTVKQNPPSLSIHETRHEDTASKAPCEPAPADGRRSPPPLSHSPPRARKHAINPNRQRPKSTLRSQQKAHKHSQQHHRPLSLLLRHSGRRRARRCQ
jgi:hypothetical protein